MNIFFTLSLRRNADLIRARFQLRQLCRMLGFDLLEQARITCAAFEFACREREHLANAKMSLAVDGRILRVWLHEAAVFPEAALEKANAKFSVPIPDADRLADEDIVWVLDNVTRLQKPDLLAELRQHNQDLLCVLTLLQQAENDSLPKPKLHRPNSAA